jgi:hypothetical protein
MESSLPGQPVRLRLATVLSTIPLISLIFRLMLLLDTIGIPIFARFLNGLVLLWLFAVDFYVLRSRRVEVHIP